MSLSRIKGVARPDRTFAFGAINIFPPCPSDIFVAYKSSWMAYLRIISNPLSRVGGTAGNAKSEPKAKQSACAKELRVSKYAVVSWVPLVGILQGCLSRFAHTCSLGATPVEILQADADSNPSEWFSRWQMRTYSWPQMHQLKKITPRHSSSMIFLCHSFRNLNLNMRVDMWSWYLIFKHTKRVCRFETSTFFYRHFIGKNRRKFQVKEVKGRKFMEVMYQKVLNQPFLGGWTHSQTELSA